MRSTETLWTRINTFNLDTEGSALPFSMRLARDNRWSAAYAQRAVAEYKKFIYLAATADRLLTPSEAVDAVWHLHLAYSRSYWLSLCRDILHKDLHHEPTQGGAREQAKFTDAYGATLERYRAEFGGEPPRDIWPAPADRFAPTRPGAARTRGAAAAGLAFLAVSLASASAAALTETVSISAVIFTIVAVAGLAFITALAVGARADRRRKDGSGCSGTNTDSHGDSGCGGCGGD